MSVSIDRLNSFFDLAKGELQKNKPLSEKKEAFRSILNQIENEPAQAASEKNLKKLEFSNHAVERMMQRGISFSPQELDKVQSAVDKATQKGAMNALIVTDKAAMVVDIKDSKVVTVVDKNNLKDNVFTKIDSTVII